VHPEHGEHGSQSRPVVPAFCMPGMERISVLADQAVPMITKDLCAYSTSFLLLMSRKNLRDHDAEALYKAKTNANRGNMYSAPGRGVDTC
jgi:hypothetical protein